MDLFDLVAKLTLDSSEYEQGLEDAETSAEGWGGKLGTAAKVGAGAMTAVTTATVAAGAAFVKGAGDVASYGDDIDKNSQKMGISATAYQEWDAILQHSGTSMSAMRGGMQKLAKAAEKGDDAFEKLGITQEDLHTMNQEELFAKTIAGLQNMESGTERTALASQLLGGSAKNLGALLNTSAEDTEAMRQKVHELGGVMSDDAVKASAAYQDSLQDMNTAIDGVKRGLVVNFLPSLTTVMDGIGSLFSGDDKKGLGLIKDGVDNFIKTLTDTIPKVIEVGGKIINALVQAIVKNLPSILQAGIKSLLTLVQGISQSLPKLVPAIVDAVLKMVETLIDNIDLIIDAAVQLMIGLATGLIKAIPKIIEKIPTIIEKLVQAFVKSVPKIAEAGVKLLTALVKNLPSIVTSIVKAVPEIIRNLLSGFASAVSSIASAGVTLLTAIVQNLPKIISTIVKKIPQIISGIVQALKDGITDMIDAGKDLIAGLGQGLINGVKAVIKKAKQAAEAIKNAVKGFFGIASPSKEFAKIGGFLMEGMAKGIDDNLGMVEDAMEGVQSAVDSNLPDLYIPANGGDFVTESVSDSRSVNSQYSDSGNGASGSVRVIDGMTFNIYGSANQNVNELADAIADRFQTLVDMRSAVWA